MGKGIRETVVVERLPDMGAWEFYVFTGEETGATVCKVALRAGTPDGVEYGVFRGEDGEPSATGVIPQPGSFTDEAREDVLKEILTAYKAHLPALRGGVVFDFYSERAEDVDEGDEGDDGEEEDADDDGER